jgi:plasmid stabilization system protein ParE
MSLSANTMPDFELRQLVEQLTKERDEALEDIERLKTYIASNISLSKAEAEARGFERGVREAAKVITEHYQSLCQEHRLLLVNRANAVLALLDPKPKTAPTPTPTPTTPTRFAQGGFGV